MTLNSPEPIVPIPAATVRPLRGSRVIVGVPGVGFRGDLRADDPVVSSGRAYVPVLAEHDYYRAEIEQIEAFAIMVPVDRVWVEQVGASQQVDDWITGIDRPQVKWPASCEVTPRVLGCRAIRAVPDGFLRHLRIVTEVYDTDGRPTVRICDEADWYRWSFSGATPTVTAVAASDVWIE